MPEIKTVRVVDLSSLFKEGDLELFQDHVYGEWTWGDTYMSLVTIHEVRLAAIELSIFSEELEALDAEIMVDLNN